jgi:hypothetical protein
MIDELKEHLPAIQQYPWAFLWTFLTGISVGWGAPAAWRRLFPVATKPKAKSRLLRKIWARISPYRPNGLQVKCIRVLRYNDANYLPAEEVARILNTAHPEVSHPLSDVMQAMDVLSSHRWTLSEIRSGPARWGEVSMIVVYQLHGAGLDYARKRNFAVGK